MSTLSRLIRRFEVITTTLSSGLHRLFAYNYNDCIRIFH